MGLISTVDCIDRSREPYLLAQGYVLRSPDGMIDRSLARRARLVRVATSVSVDVEIRIPLTQPASVVLLDRVWSPDPPLSYSVEMRQVLVDSAERVLAVETSGSIVGQILSDGDSRLAAMFPPIPPSWGRQTRLVIRIHSGSPSAWSVGEVMAWLVEPQAYTPRMSDDVDQRDRIAYAITGAPIRGVDPGSSRRVQLVTAPAADYRDAIDRRSRWLKQGLGLIVPMDTQTPGPIATAEHILQHGIVGLPIAGSGQYDGTGHGGITGSVQLGVVELTSSSLRLIEDAIMALASYTLRPHAYKPLAGEYIAAFTGAALTTQAAAAGRYDVWPIVLPIDTTVDQAAFEVTGAATGDAAVVIHASDDLGRPAGLVAQSSPISTGTTGLRTVPISATLRGGQQYWVGLWTQAAPTVRAVSDALPISWAAGAPHTARRVLRRVVTWGGTGPVWSYTASDPAAAMPAAVLLRVA